MDVLVIGAGPTGCIAARKLTENHKVKIFQEKAEKRVRCAGLVSKSGIERLSIKLRKIIIKNQVRGALLYPPSGDVIEIDGRTTKAYVIDRIEFDQFLLNSVIDKGVNLIEKRITDKDIKNSKADRIIIATGTNYNLQRKLNLQFPREFIIGAQYGMKIECDPNLVELHFNVPDFFSWVIPVGDYARIGLCVKGNPMPHLNNFVKRLRKEGRIKSDRILNRNFGIIPIYSPRLKTDYGKIVLVGDAAGQVKASTGGGIVTGGIAARFSGEMDYEVKWRKEIGRELYLHLIIHRFLSTLSEKNLSRLFSLVRDYKGVIEDRGDMDIASKTLRAIFRNPKFTARFLIHLPSYLFDFIM